MSDTKPPLLITSPTNPRIKTVVKLRQRSHRDELNITIVEGYRELRRAIDNKHPLQELFFCREMFQGTNEDTLMQDAAAAGTELIECSPVVFTKLSYRDRPDGLLSTASQVHNNLSSLTCKENPLVIVAESIEKPGNLGTILRSADASKVDAVIVCDRCTDINNPNVVRASIGTLFSVPVVETSTEEALAWLKENNISLVAATPHTDKSYWDIDMTSGTAIAVGTEQYGLSETWLESADHKISIPMLGQADSLNVASATTILLYEAVRQRTTSG